MLASDSGSDGTDASFAASSIYAVLIHTGRSGGRCVRGLAGWYHRTRATTEEDLALHPETRARVA